MLVRSKAVAVERAGKLEVSAASLEAERVQLYDELEDLRLEREGLVKLRAGLEKDVAVLREREEALSVELESTSLALTESEKGTQDLTASYQGLVQDLEREVQQGEIEIEQLRTGLRLAVSDEILFASGSARLDKGGAAVLAKVATNIAKLDHVIDVEGHTDNIPIKGPLTKRYPSNWELAGARASSVVRLFERAGIDGERLQAISRAEFAPVSSNNDAEGRGQNRRIEIRLRPRVNDAVKPEAIQEILSEPDAPVAEQVDDTATDPVAPKTD
jgi:chemotaxis protein MotB